MGTDGGGGAPTVTRACGAGGCEGAIGGPNAFAESADAETSAALGVPVILPEVESIDAHAGSPVADHVIAPLPPVAEGATTRAEPTSAVTAEGAVIATDG